MGVRIVTDSSAVVPPEEIARHGIAVVPLTIAWNGSEATNGDLSYAEFEVRAARGEMPRTSAPSPGSYASAYEETLGSSDELLVLTPPSELSSTHANAALAARDFGGRVRVVDSRSAAAGQGLIAIEAARTATSGGSLDAVAQRTSDVASRVRLWATLRKLDFLKRSGRVPAVAAFATNALDLHPVFRFVDGDPAPVTAARGDRRAADRVFRAFEQSRPDGSSAAHVIVVHSSRPSEARELDARVLALAPGAETWIAEVTAAMAAHIGPGLLGLAWWWE